MEKITVLVNAQNREAVFGEKYFERLRKSGELKIYDRDDFSDEAYEARRDEQMEKELELELELA